MNATPLVPADLFKLALASDPQLAPDGSVFFVRTTLDEPSDETRTSIWRVAPGGSSAPFTSGTKDSSPRVALDGAALAFIADRGDGKRAYVLPLGGGEARAVTPAYPSIADVTWSPDGRTLAFVATVPHVPETARIAHDERSGARHIRALPFKSDDAGLLDGKRRHIFAVASAGESEPRQLTSGDFDAGMPSWSPDGTRIAFAAQVGLPETSFRSDIYTIAASGGEPVRLTPSNGPAEHPVYSRDGREIAFVGHFHGDDIGGSYNNELLVVPADGGAVRSLSAPLDRTVGDTLICDTRSSHVPTIPVWLPDDRGIAILLSNEGVCGIAAFARDGSEWHVVVGGERDVNGFALGADGSFAYIVSDPLLPSDVFLQTPNAPERRLTTLNPWLAERNLVAPHRLRPRASDGTVLDVFVLDVGVESPGPLVLQVHGGPHTAYGFAFFFEFQVLATHGISVAYGNPRGSQSYGQAYSSAIAGQWGGVDASDVLAMLDAVLEPGAYDRARIGVAGGSYGGFMTTWLLGHSQRFAAGVSMRAVNDFVSEVGASDLGWFLETELRAPWGDGGAALFAGSPMRAAHAIHAPLLVEHSERDYRCPIDQGEQLFTLLRRLGRNAEFVRFTGDGHDLSRSGKPRNRVLRLRAIAHWLVRHLRPAGIEPLPDTAGALFAPLPTESEPGEVKAAS